MNIRILTTTRALAVALGLISTGAFAQSTTAMEDAAIQADEAAEAEALAAEIVEEEAVLVDQIEAAEAAERAKAAGERGQKAFMDSKK